MNEKFKDLIFALDEKGLVELYKICKIRYFELYVEDNNEYANRYKDICINIRQELTNRGIMFHMKQNNLQFIKNYL